LVTLYVDVYGTNGFYRVTIVRDKMSRTSKGIAFVLFVKREDARKAIHAMNRKEVSVLICTIGIKFCNPIIALWAGHKVQYCH